MIDDYEEIISKIGNMIENIDKRNFFNNATIYAEYNDEFLGAYVFKENRYKSSSEMDIDRFIEQAYMIMEIKYNLEINSKEELTYLKLETMNVDDIPGIGTKKIWHRLGNPPEDLEHVKVYYYQYKGETWIIADVLVTNGLFHVYKLNSNT